MLIGWSIVIYVAKYVTKEADLTVLFDPYTILDVSFTASEREIKSHYRKLSLKYHPDKLPKDLTEEQRSQAEQAYIRLTSAYKALTDEVTRENFLRYGHPDGEQPATHGIALPQFLVEGKYSSLVVVLYFMVIGILLPFIVGKWWSNVKSHTRKVCMLILLPTLFVSLPTGILQRSLHQMLFWIMFWKVKKLDKNS